MGRLVGSKAGGLGHAGSWSRLKAHEGSWAIRRARMRSDHRNDVPRHGLLTPGLPPVLRGFYINGPVEEGR